MTFKVPNQYRIRSGPMASDDSVGLCGAFEIPIMEIIIDGIKTPKVLENIPTKIGSKKDAHAILVVIADDGCNGRKIEDSWEHVSLYKIYNGARYIPSWMEMSLITGIFWGDEDCVIQYHPPKDDSINLNPYVLHLWRPVGVNMPMPPKELV